MNLGGRQGGQQSADRRAFAGHGEPRQAPTTGTPVIVTTMWCDDDQFWSNRTVLVDRRSVRPQQYLARFLAATKTADAVIVVGALGAKDYYIDLVAGMLLKLRRRRPLLLVSDSTWDEESGRLRAATGSEVIARAVPKAMVSVLDGAHVHYGVLSSEEVSGFPATWGVSADRVHFTPFCSTIEVAVGDRPAAGGYIFSGGNPLRRYQLLEEATVGLDWPVVVASSWRPAGRESHVTARSVDHGEFVELLRGANVVVLPLEKRARSAGQQTYLNAMLAKRPVIVTEAPGVRDYVEHERTGLVVAPRASAIRAALEWVLDPSNSAAVREMTERASEEVRRRFTPEKYRSRLVELCEMLLAGGNESRRPGPGSEAAC